MHKYAIYDMQICFLIMHYFFHSMNCFQRTYFKVDESTKYKDLWNKSWRKCSRKLILEQKIFNQRSDLPCY